jgi:hypothetical protein
MLRRVIAIGCIALGALIVVNASFAAFQGMRSSAIIHALYALFGLSLCSYGMYFWFPPPIESRVGS